MKRISLLLLLCAVSITAYSQSLNVLVFSKTEGFRHANIPSGIAAIERLGADHNISVNATEDAIQFTYDNLMQYDAVIFLSTTGDVLNGEQKSAFEQYIQSGGGYVGIHAASDTEHNWPWYGKLVGAYFADHPSVQQATIEVSDKVHPSTNFLPDYWVRTDEWYNFRENPRGNVHVLATLDEGSYTGGNMGYDHPIAWMHEYDGGRSWYTGGGHTEASFSEEHFLNHILGGIQYASGAVSGQYEGTVDSNFLVTVVDHNPHDPMQLAVLPNLDLLYIERSGTVKFKDFETGLIGSAAELDVESGREDGLLGIVLDPDFETNSWLYLFYSPTEESVQRLSRFTYDNGSFDLESEKIILTIPVQRDECCHSGGDLEFETEGNLYISTGDNVNPFGSDGYTPIDERVGREPFDAQMTSANTNDLRGKILRIRPEADGTYTIPEGNLFTSSDEGREEIYVMGVRNPFRMDINQVTNELVWGDVGPDAREFSSSRGPKGYDEFNRTKTSGNFGWPYCIADSRPYNEYDFATGNSGSSYDCGNLVNNSPNNTGAVNLPPARPAWIYYPYDFFDELPEFNTGGRAGMVGGYYHYNETLNETGAFPEYFDGSLFIMEWTRHWIKEIRFDSDGNLMQINPFLPDLDLKSPIDMQIGPDGAMYVIEWGSGNGGNPDSRIIKIQYLNNLGNRPPQAVASASVTNGPIPLEVDFTARRSSDPDGGELSYAWDLNGDGTFDANTIDASYTYAEKGSYLVQLTVTDSEGDRSVDQVKIVAGNTAPTVTIERPVDGGFYEAGDIIPYTVSVTDPEQGSISNGIDCADVITEASIGHNNHAHGEGTSIGCEGVFTAKNHGDGHDNIFYVFNAEYTDDGGAADAHLTGKGTSILHPKLKQAEHAQDLVNVQIEQTGDFMGGGWNIGFVKHNSALKFSPMNFEGIDYMTLRYATLSTSADVEVHVGNTRGTPIAKLHTGVTGAWQEYDYFTTELQDPSGTHDVWLVFKKKGSQDFLGNVNWIEFHGKGVAQEDPDSLKGLVARYYSNDNFLGTPITRKEPMIAWNWKQESPHPSIPSDGFSVRWDGELRAPAAGKYTLSTEAINGTSTVWVDDNTIITTSSTSGEVTLSGDEPHTIRVEYVHSSGDAGVYLRWKGKNPENVIHTDYLTPDSDLLPLSIRPEEKQVIPEKVSLSQNYPNPFNPSTQIEFSLPAMGKVSLQVYNIVGQKVQQLIYGHLQQGMHSINFNAAGLSSGVYIYQLKYEDTVLSNKMILMK